MTLPKILSFFTIILFGFIGIAALFKDGNQKTPEPKKSEAPLVFSEPIELEFTQENAPKPVTPSPLPTLIQTPPKTQPVQQSMRKSVPAIPGKKTPPTHPLDDSNLPNANRIEELFNKGSPQLPIVETITYKSRVAWQKGRPAWLSDYASHYKTSRHFIARSLNGKADYFKQDVADGDRFNVFKEGKNINFYLIVDNSRCKMWLYSVDVDSQESILLKRYDVGLGREDGTRHSGYLTPLGKYSLGNRIAIYKPTMMGYHGGQKVEMVRWFGTRWIPFEKEISNCSQPAKGFGIHGVPWVNGPNNTLVEDKSSIGKYQSDGCIRMCTQDIEELFAIIITKPTTIEIVASFYDAEFPGIRISGQ